jgi:hypothetical protein
MIALEAPENALQPSNPTQIARQPRPDVPLPVAKVSLFFPSCAIDTSCVAFGGNRNPHNDLKRSQLPDRAKPELRQSRQDRSMRYDWRKFLKSPPQLNRKQTWKVCSADCQKRKPQALPAEEADCRGEPAAQSFVCAKSVGASRWRCVRRSACFPPSALLVRPCRLCRLFRGSLPSGSAR